jgi:hypothetical protein
LREVGRWTSLKLQACAALELGDTRDTRKKKIERGLGIIVRNYIGCCLECALYTGRPIVYVCMSRYRVENGVRWRLTVES